MKTLSHLTAIGLTTLLSQSALGHGIHSAPSQTVTPEFDIVDTRVSSDQNQLVFRMSVSGKAGESKPTPSGQLGGARVFSYVWPTSLDPAEVGFESKAGILAFAVTSHPDFDDTPLFDENGNGKKDDDGNLWHSHWVVLVPDESCGPSGMKVRDIPAGTTPRLPKTWPGLPILIDSPGYVPAINESTVEVRVPFNNIGAAVGAKFDGVTSGLRVNASVHAPLLCIENIFKVASGNLSLPGEITQ